MFRKSKGLARLFGLAAVFVSLATAASAQEAPKKPLTVTLLGSGTPGPSPERFSMATLVEAGNQKLMFDAGRGSSIRLWQAGAAMGKLDAVFLTHLHSDHVIGLPDILLTGWLGGLPYANRQTPLRLIGPEGTKDMADNIEKAFSEDRRIRIEDEMEPEGGSRFNATEFSADGVVYEKDGVRVTAFQVDHGDHIKPAYGYRVDYDGHAVVLSGDTRPVENLIKHSAGADVLIHEVAMAAEPLQSQPAIQRILAHHTTPEQAGTIFTTVKPKLAVYSHIVQIGSPQAPAPKDADLEAATRKTYSGPLLIGVDLNRVIVTDDIKVEKYDNASHSFK